MLKPHFISGMYLITCLVYFLCFLTHNRWVILLYLLQWDKLIRDLIPYKRSLHVSKSVYNRYLRRWDLGPLWTFVNLYFGDFMVKWSLKMDIGYLLIKCPIKTYPFRTKPVIDLTHLKTYLNLIIFFIKKWKVSCLNIAVDHWRLKICENIILSSFKFMLIQF